MNLGPLFLQLGIAGAVLFVGYRIAVLLIGHWSANEAAKVGVLARAEADRTQVIANGFAQITATTTTSMELLATLHTKFDEHISTKAAIKQALEEVTGQHEMPAPPMPVEEPQELELAPPRPFAKVRTGNTPPGGVPAGAYSHVKRAGTKGGG